MKKNIIMYWISGLLIGLAVCQSQACTWEYHLTIGVPIMVILAIIFGYFAYRWSK